MKTSPKQLILDIATRLYYAQGYHATGYNQILTAINVGQADVYQNQDSKTEIGLAYLRDESEAWFKELDSLLAIQELPAEKLLTLFDYAEQFVQRPDGRGGRYLTLLTEIGEADPLMQAQVVNHKAELRTRCQRLAAASLAPDAEDGRVHALADATYLLFEGAVIESSLYRDNWPVQAAKRAVRILIENQA